MNPTRFDVEPAGSRIDPAGRIGFSRRFSRNYDVAPVTGWAYSTVPEGRWSRGQLASRDRQPPFVLPAALPMYDRTDPNSQVRK